VGMHKGRCESLTIESRIRHASDATRLRTSIDDLNNFPVKQALASCRWSNLATASTQGTRYAGQHKWNAGPRRQAHCGLKMDLKKISKDLSVYVFFKVGHPADLKLAWFDPTEVAEFRFFGALFDA
jgi:hypothetical protein